MKGFSEQMSAWGKGAPGDVFRVFLKLGLTAFGGPIAHLGYFRDELVVRRKWLSEEGYADLVALCQFLPGPTSSQVGFALGLLRGGPLGALAAWAAFTLPSALLLVVFALLAPTSSGWFAEGLLQGLKLVAVVIVAHAVWGMARTLTPDWQRVGIALGAALIAVLAAGVVGQVAAIGFGVLAGLALCRGLLVSEPAVLSFGISRVCAGLCLFTFLLLLVGLPLVAVIVDSPALFVFDAFYRSASLVFGGGHVVLPLLQAEVVAPGWVSDDVFLAGYGAAQALPGPLFTFAAYLGVAMEPVPGGFVMAALGLVAIFLPGFLLLVGVLPFWSELGKQPVVRAAMRGANAAVVGLLAAALFDPLWTHAVFDVYDVVLVGLGLLVLSVWKAPPLAVVLLVAAGGVVLPLIR